jgi:hypothetical protein
MSITAINGMMVLLMVLAAQDTRSPPQMITEDGGCLCAQGGQTWKCRVVHVGKSQFNMCREIDRPK